MTFATPLVDSVRAAANSMASNVSDAKTAILVFHHVHVSKIETGENKWSGNNFLYFLGIFRL